MKKELIKLANHLDRIGLVKEANYVDALINKYATPFQIDRVNIMNLIRLLNDMIKEDASGKDPIIKFKECIEEKFPEMTEDLQADLLSLYKCAEKAFGREYLSELIRIINELKNRKVKY